MIELIHRCTTMKQLSQQITVFAFIIFVLTFSRGQSPVDVAGNPTHVANSSGVWSSSTTWGGQSPTMNARIHIPAGKDNRVQKGEKFG